MKKTFIPFIFLLSSCTNDAEIYKLREENDSLKSYNLALQIDLTRYEIIMDRLYEKDSVLYEEVTSNLE
jgi:hypothetical protein